MNSVMRSANALHAFAKKAFSCLLALVLAVGCIQIGDVGEAYAAPSLTSTWGYTPIDPATMTPYATPTTANPNSPWAYPLEYIRNYNNESAGMNVRMFYNERTYGWNQSILQRRGGLGPKTVGTNANAGYEVLYTSANCSFSGYSGDSFYGGKNSSGDDANVIYADLAAGPDGLSGNRAFAFISTPRFVVKYNSVGEYMIPGTTEFTSFDAVVNVTGVEMNYGHSSDPGYPVSYWNQRPTGETYLDVCSNGTASIPLFECDLAQFRGGANPTSSASGGFVAGVTSPCKFTYTVTLYEHGTVNCTSAGTVTGTTYNDMCYALCASDLDIWWGAKASTDPLYDPVVYEGVTFNSLAGNTDLNYVIGAYWQNGGVTHERLNYGRNADGTYNGSFWANENHSTTATGVWTDCPSYSDTAVAVKVTTADRMQMSQTVPKTAGSMVQLSSGLYQSDTKGTLTIAKQVDNLDIAEVPDDGYQIYVQGPNGYEQIVTLHPVTEQLPDGTSVIWDDVVLDNLDFGTYTINEVISGVDVDGYTRTTTYSGVDASNQVTLSSTNKDASVVVTNAYTQQKGSITVSKTATGSPDASKVYSMTVAGPNGYSQAVILTNGQSRTLSNLEWGTYTVTEADASISGYSLDTKYSADGGAASVNPASVTIGATSLNHTVAVTNAYTPDITYGSLTLSKTVTGLTNDTTTYYFDITGPNGYSSVQTLTNGQTKTISGLAFGTYTVTEQAVAKAGYKVTTTYAATSTPTLNAASPNQTVVVTNDYQRLPATITLSKTMTGLPDASKTFSFTVTGPNGYSNTVTLTSGQSQVLSNLDWGTYTVTEAGAEVEGYSLTTGYSVNGATRSAGNSTSVTVNDTALTGTVGFYNDYKVLYGTITVTKRIKAYDPGGVYWKNGTPSFLVTVTGTSGLATGTVRNVLLTIDESSPVVSGYYIVSATLDKLYYGDYTVVENDTVRYEFESLTVENGTVSGSTANLTIGAANNSASATLTNAVKRYDGGSDSVSVVNHVSAG